MILIGGPIISNPGVHCVRLTVTVLWRNLFKFGANTNLNIFINLELICDRARDKDRCFVFTGLLK